MPQPFVSEWPLGFAAAAAILLRASDFAESLRRSTWDFAVELRELHRVGLSRADLRWLICQGLLDHREEVSAAPSGERTFHTTGMLTFRRRTCFVLTPVGRAMARELSSSSAPQTVTTFPPGAPTDVVGKSQFASDAGGSHQTSRNANCILEPSALTANAGSPMCGKRSRERGADCSGSSHQLRSLKPVWDRELFLLTLGNVVVKEYKTPAPNQHLILSAFQEEDWPLRVDDPLPPAPDLEPKRRLHETIISLNRNQRNHLLRFSGDGQGRGVRWVSLADGSLGS